MATFYDYKISGPVTDGDVISVEMTEQAERGYISINFYSDNEFLDLVSATGGTIVFTASETGERFGTIDSGTINAITEDYDRPNWSGSVKFIKATLSSITGASFFRATIFRFGG